MKNVVSPTIPNSSFLSEADAWTSVCDVDIVLLDRGVAALILPKVEVDEPLAVAIFRISPLCLKGDLDSISSQQEAQWRAVSHLDPTNGAPVMARGLVGSAETEAGIVPTVTSPLYKQRYDLRTGQCLDDDSLRLEVFDIAISDSRVWVKTQKQVSR